MLAWKRALTGPIFATTSALYSCSPTRSSAWHPGMHRPRDAGIVERGEDRFTR